jgi:PAS domain S-box-containing protein
MQEALIETKARHETLIETIPIGVTEIDISGAILYCNQTFLKLVGYEMQELIGKKISEFLVSDVDPARVWKDMEKVSHDRPQSTPYFTKVRTKDGKILDVRMDWAYTRDTHGKTVGFVASVTDIAEHRQMEKKLKKGEKTLRSVFFASPVGIALLTPDRMTSWMNDRMASIVGYTSQDLKDKNTRALYPTDEEFSRVGKIVYGEVKQGNIGTAYTKWVHKDGRILDIHVNAAAIDPKDLSAGIVFTAVDITERKEAERRLLESEERYRTAIEHSNDGFALIKKDKHIYVNRKFLEIFGYDKLEELIGKSPMITVHPDYREEVLVYRQKKQWRERIPSRLEFKGIKKDGTAIFLEASLASTIYQGETVILAYLRDITERKRTEEALYESEEKYRNVVEHSLAGVYIVQDNLFRFVNKRWCEMLGYTYEEAVDTFGPIDTAYPEDKKIVEENIRRRLTGEADHIEYDFRTVRKDGKVLNVKVLGSLTIYKGRTAVTGNIIDITREKTLESQLLQAQKMEAIGTLAGGIAHDFNNILTVLSGYGTLLQLKIDNDNPLRVYVDQILSASQRASNLTRSLLAFSRREPVILQPVNINDILKGTEKLLKRLISEDITLKVLLAPEDIVVMADATQIDQILFNLTTNARDAMPRGDTHHRDKIRSIGQRVYKDPWV